MRPDGNGPLHVLHPTAVIVGPALYRQTARISQLGVQRREDAWPSKNGQLIRARFCAYPPTLHFFFLALR